MMSKRDHGRVERRLIAALTRACEDAKPLLPGFTWLTHEVDYQRFPERLMITWVFDTDANLARALKSDDWPWIHDLTAEALADAGIAVDDITCHVDLDSEQACQRTHAGNWERRLKAKPARH
ncbi:hypothetical protein EZI54_19805 [Marinobacter halodurans]|uniref:Fis family transcriptional regulator n=1 Tax=Marinobacter halodurans TaxID=2528979 RepID=A0ABY1ZJC1_9GAMM|nr:hypothetical protein [Marinobacter halodurans]TBW49373.1 hypothetical protein EZI54_19805 [Marinobacter halodurans]